MISPPRLLRDQAVCVNVHAEGEVRLGFHGQVRLDSSWPAGIYTNIMLLRRVAFPDFCEPCLPSPADKPPAVMQESRRLNEALTHDSVADRAIAFQDHR